MRRKVVLVCAVVAFGATSRARGDTLQIDVIRPPHVVSALTFGADGFLYVGGHRDLFRYDGLSFERAAASLASRHVSFIAPTGSGGTFAVTGQWQVLRSAGVAGGRRQGIQGWVWSPQLRRFTTKNFPGNVTVFGLATDRHGPGVWLATSVGLWRGDLDAWITVTDGLPTNTAIDALAASETSVWVACAKQLWRKTNQGFRVVTALPDVTTLAVSASGAWAASTTKAWRVDSGGHVVDVDFLQAPQQGAASAMPVQEVLAVHTASDGIVWVGTNAGLFAFDDDGRLIRRWTAAQGLPDPRVQAITDDAMGSVWAGTSVGGMVRLRPPLVQNFGAPEGLSDTVNSVVATNDGALWVGGLDGVYRTSGQARRAWDVDADPRLRRTRVLVADSGDVGGKEADVIAATSSNTLYRLSVSGAAELLAVTPPLSSPVAAMLLTPPSTTQSLWTIHLDGTVVASDIQRINGRVHSLERARSFSLADSGCTGAPTDAHLSAAGDVWIAAGNGLGHIDRNGQLHCLRGQGLPSRDINVVLSDGERLWVGVGNDGGILVREKPDEAFVGAAVPDGLSCDSIAALVDDGHGGLWAGCGHGVQWVAKDSLLKAGRRRFPAVASVGLVEADGLRSAFVLEEGFPRAVLGRQGDAFFATRMGVSQVRKLSRPRAEQTATVEVASVTVNGVVQPLAKAFDIPSIKAHVEVLIASPSLVSPSRVALAYQLSGGEAGWRIQPGGARQIDLADLAEGHYRLNVRSTDGAGAWRPSGATLTFRIARPLYMRWWFLLLCASLATAALCAVFVLRMRRTRLRFAAIANDRARVARELHDLLGQSFTAVGLQIDAARRTLQPEASQARTLLENARAMVRHAKEDLRHAVWNLRNAQVEPMPLASALQRLVVELRKASATTVQVHFSATGSPPVPSALHEHEFQQVAREALWNALRHAKDATRIDVLLSVGDQMVELVVRDDGHTVLPALDHLPAQGHFGIVGMFERAARIGGEITLGSVKPQGIEVKLKVPLARWSNQS